MPDESGSKSPSKTAPTPAKSLISQALSQLLRPLVRILLRQGIAFDSLSELLKQAYVEVADKEFGLPGKKQTVSRISTITGLTRKEVTRIQQLDAIDISEINQQFNRAARVIVGWISEDDFLDAQQQPLALSLEQGPHSFNELVKRFSGDIPPRAIADELMRVGAIEQTHDGKVKLVQRAYVPLNDMGEKIKILGTDVSDLIQTIDHNIQGQQPAHYQRKVCYNAIPKSRLPELREKLNVLAQQNLEHMNDIMLQYDSDANKQVEKGSARAGVGIYYFEEDVEK